MRTREYDLTKLFGLGAKCRQIKLTLNQRVAGSNPAGRTILSNRTEAQQAAESNIEGHTQGNSRSTSTPALSAPRLADTVAQVMGEPSESSIGEISE